MFTILDSNILIRIVDTNSVQRPIALSAVTELRSCGHILRSVPQAHYEFWVVATRPIANNGLGLSVPECLEELRDISLQFPLLRDSSDLYDEWLSLVSHHACSGKVAHDARYVAAMKTHAVTHLLTFNVGDFARYPGVTILDPNSVMPARIP